MKKHEGLFGLIVCVAIFASTIFVVREIYSIVEQQALLVIPSMIPR